MPPKKKGNKKAQDDWEAELGESVAPSAPTNGTNGDANGDHEEDEEGGGGGGLMARMRKSKEKRKKKGLDNDFVEGEDPAGAADDQDQDAAAKAPEEATMDDEFGALPAKKGGKGKPTPKETPAATDDAEEGGRILTKAEKEKLKKEREKQRKREQVCTCTWSQVRQSHCAMSNADPRLPKIIGRKEEDSRIR
jgi:translation initiation factor 5B